MHVTGTLLSLYFINFNKFLDGCYPNRKCFDNKGLQVYFEHLELAHRMVCCHKDQIITHKSVQNWIQGKVGLDGLNEAESCIRRKFVIERCRFDQDLTIKAVIERLNLLWVDELELVRIQTITKGLLTGLTNIRHLVLKDISIKSFDFLFISLPNLSSITLNNVKALDWSKMSNHQRLTHIYIYDTNLTISNIKYLLQTKGLEKLHIEISFDTRNHTRSILVPIFIQDGNTSKSLSNFSLIGYHLNRLSVNTFLDGLSLVALNLSRNLIETLPE